MAEARPLKVALLARAGNARDHLRRAVRDLGAELVLEVEPAGTDSAALRACGASAVLVSVEPATEAALDRLHDVLLDPALSVLFDEAETTARLDGWDLARWARHLAAKLVGGGVLPPTADLTDAGDELSLAPWDEAPAPSVRETPVVPAPAIAAMGFGALSLVPIDEAPTVERAGETGLVLVLSGIGGLDAARQLLRGLPQNFPLAVLLQQEMDGGRHDRLVEQLSRVSQLPVALAETSETPPPRTVRVLPDGLTVAGARDLPAEPTARVAAVAASGGAVVVLSGADAAFAPVLREARAAGLTVLVQEPSSCFDAGTASALAAAGAPTVAPGDLAARLDACFPS